MKKLLIILFLFIGISLYATDTNYYVDNTGTGDTLATIAEVNGLTLAADDSVFFKKGCVWREQLTVPNSGTAGHFIVFTSYGTGLKPQILGSTQAITWTVESGNVWKSATSITTNPHTYGNIWFEEIDGSVNTGAWKSSVVNCVAEYDWYWESNVLYVYAATDPDSRYASVEAGQRFNSIFLNSKEYIEINGIDIYYNTVAGIQGEYPVIGLTGLMIKNCDIGYLSYEDGLGYGVEALYNTSVFEYDTIHDCGRRGLSLYNYSNAGSGVNISDITVQYCVFYQGYHVTGIDCAAGSTVGDDGNIYNVTIRNNLFYEDENRVTSGTLFIGLYGLPAGGGLTDTVYIYDNIFKYTDGCSINPYRDVNNLHIYNNTFYGFTKTNIGAEQTFIKFDNVFPGNKTYIKNNIFYNDAVYANNPDAYSIFTYETLGGTYSDKDDVDADYNLYYNTDADTKIVLNWYDPHNWYTMAQWEAMKTAIGWEANSPTPADPLFTSAPTDLTLSVGSPAIGAGIGVGLNTDYAGNAWNDTPSIGAYEYDSEPPDPPGLPEITASLTNIKSISAVMNGIIVSDGGGTITESGICWSSSANPTISDRKIISGKIAEDDTFLLTVIGLHGSNTYHARAYVKNESGTAYSEDIKIDTTKQTVVMSSDKVGVYNNKIGVLK